MKNSTKRIYTYVNIIRTIIPIIAFKTSKNNNLIKDDILRLKHESPFVFKSGIMTLSYLLLKHRGFRNIFYYRIRNNMILKYLSRILLKPLESMEVNGDIGGGLVVHHGAGTILYPYKAGNNLRVWQQVTIGRIDRMDGNIDTPTIGDNVDIYTGSIVIGNIIIGNNVVIGAGTVVTKNIPDNYTVVGNPARIVKRNGIKVNEIL